MRNKLVNISAIFIISLFTLTAARDMTAIMVAKSKTGTSNAGIYLSRMGSGSGVSRIKAVGSPNFAYFSPDGSKICYSAAGKLFIMNNDGSGAEEVISSGFPTDQGQFAWTKAGIVWVQGDKKIHKYNPATKQRSVHVEFSAIGTSGTTEETMVRLLISGDAKKFWLRQTFTGSCEKSDAGGSPRPFVELNDDFSVKRKVNICDWGHGEGMPLSGDVVFMNEFGTHFNMKTWKYVNGVLSDQTMTNMPAEIPSSSQGINSIVPRCANNDSIMGKWCHNGKDTDFKYFAFNWRKTPTQLAGYFPQPAAISDGSKEDDLLLTDLWDGALPAGTSPFMNTDKSQLTFLLSNLTSAPAAQTITVTNSSAGELAKVNVSGAPAWLTVTVNGNGGNTQTISNAIKMTSLPSNDTQATVTLSSAGATNQAQYSVRLYLPSSIPAPGQLTAEAVGDSLLDVKLTWVDAASDETGFVIERTNDTTQTWAQVATPGANTTTYTDNHRPVGQWYYRVRTVKNSSQSHNSAAAAILVQGIEWVRIASPVEGQQLVAGSTAYIKWTANRIAQVSIELSTDQGIFWSPVNQLGGIATTDSRWGNYPWVVPQTPGVKGMIKVSKYGSTAVDDISGEFLIVTESSILKSSKTTAQNLIRIRNNGKQIAVSVSVPGKYSLKVIAPNGKVLHHLSGNTPGKTFLVPLLSNGVYLVDGTIGEKKITEQFISIAK